MELLILGGSGFVSSRLAEMALREGHDVWTVTRGLRPARTLAHPVTADRHDAAQLRSALAGLHFDACLDCICYTAQDAETDLAVLPEFTDRLVVISTDSVYDPHSKRNPQNEDGVYLTDGGYGANKRLMEEALLRKPDVIRWTVFRPGHVFGEGSLPGCYPEETRNAAIPDRIRSGEPMRLVGGGHYLFQPIYADDLCRAMLGCIGLESTFGEIFCIGGPDVITNRQYYEMLADILGCPVRFETIDEEGYLEAHPAASGHLCQRVYDLSKLRASGIPMPATGLREGLSRQIRWLEEHGSESERS